MADLWREARVRLMAVDEAADVAAWRYGGDCSVYGMVALAPGLRVQLISAPTQARLDQVRAHTLDATFSADSPSAPASA